MSELVVINQECLGCWRTESFRKTDHNLEAEYYMLQSTLELWVLRAVYAQADWINTGKHLKEKQGLLVNTCKFLLCLLNVCKFISPCFHMTLDSLWPKNCWARKRIGYTELNFSFSCGIQRAERVVNVFLFVCLLRLRVSAVSRESAIMHAPAKSVCLYLALYLYYLYLNLDIDIICPLHWL